MVVSAEFILSTYFSRSDTPLTGSMLLDLRFLIDDLLKPSHPMVYIDLSLASLSSAIEQFPERFCWHGNDIVGIKSTDVIYDANIPDEVKSIITRAISEWCIKNECTFCCGDGYVRVPCLVLDENGNDGVSYEDAPCPYCTVEEEKKEGE